MERNTSYSGFDFALVEKQEQTLLAALGMIKAILASDNPTEKITEFVKKLTRYDSRHNTQVVEENKTGMAARQETIEFFIRQLLTDNNQSENKGEKL